MASRWHISRAEGELTLSRERPARFDVVASTVLPQGDPLRLAHQVRQDLWRALQRVRGFSPVVRLTRQGEAIRVEAGGRVAPPVAPGLAAEIAALLESPARRDRWVAQAKRSKKVL
ncbi:hypothetical protein [Phaeobacter sp. HF9A]|uniref:hypothetical protein n=1 Tax=Phaeobacter sp. HF9A TaxID=2721561 RepID=UPI00142FDC88|nr:hypothetical protein [Phaeobacter sp. HF9A]NIZ14996.1 hypothetical protein [Phaeobacter sp. HF9A]